MSDQKVITYVPEESSNKMKNPANAAEMGTIRRGLWLYTHQLGLNFTLVLLLSLFYQGFVAAFISLKAIRSLPLLSGLSTSSEMLPQLLATVLSLTAGGIIQGLIVAELAQVVWLRRPDKLKVRLMADSLWWWVMLVILLLTILLDFALLFLSVTGTTDLGRAWEEARHDQLTFFIDVLLSLLNLLTLLRCASVMHTSTSEEIHQEVEERLKAIAEEILIDAGDSAREKAAQVWQKLSVNPQRFLPLHEAVFDLISQQHPKLVPPKLGGNAWAYDFTGNTFAILPPDLHQALLQSRHRVKPKPTEYSSNATDHYMDADQEHLWKLPPQDLAKVIAYNLETYGKPRFVDVTEPQTPRFVTSPVQFDKLYDTAEPEPTAIVETKAGSSPSNQPNSTSLTLSREEFVASLTPAEKVLFASWLTTRVFPQVYGVAFMPVEGVSIFEVFDTVELQFYFRRFKQGQGRTHRA